MYHFMSVITRLRRDVNRMLTRIGTLMLFWGLNCQAVLAGLPTIEPPSSNGGSGLMGQIKGYLQDGVVIGGLVIAAIAFINVANAAINTFVEVRDGKSTWFKFGSIVVVGVVLLVAVIWLLTKSTNIIL
ncbi:TIGR03745 family integrating conjugative element membrane protein [Enterobacteriaceae bacterium ESL0689]|nr:TIGR03745 family integrating conjugative element membrane protein [Enterobacteriaceae bacterium ESL0689]